MSDQIVEFTMPQSSFTNAMASSLLCYAYRVNCYALRYVTYTSRYTSRRRSRGRSSSFFERENEEPTKSGVTG